MVCVGQRGFALTFCVKKTSRLRSRGQWNKSALYGCIALEEKHIFKPLRFCQSRATSPWARGGSLFLFLFLKNAPCETAFYPLGLQQKSPHKRVYIHQEFCNVRGCATVTFVVLSYPLSIFR